MTVSSMSIQSFPLLNFLTILKLVIYSQSTKYVCPETSCEGCDSNHFIRMHIPGASENQTIRFVLLTSATLFSLWKLYIFSEGKKEQE